MANELTATAALKFTKGVIDYRREFRNKQFDVAGDAYMSNVISVGTSQEQITETDAIGTAGMCLFYNLDGTNYIELGYDNGGFVAFIKIKPNQWAMFQPSGTLQAKADTAACLLEVIIIEE